MKRQKGLLNRLDSFFFLKTQRIGFSSWSFPPITITIRDGQKEKLFREVKDLLDSCRSFDEGLSDNRDLAETAKATRGVKNSSLLVSDSTIPFSGKGVFSRAVFRKGTTLCLYPGLFYPPPPTVAVTTTDGDLSSLSAKEIEENLGLHSDLKKVQQRSDYVLNCPTIGGFLDGFHWRNGQSPAVKPLDSVDPLSSADRDAWKSTEHLSIAVGHYINHPGALHKPNVDIVDFVWADWFEWLRHHNPNDKPSSSLENEIIAYQEMVFHINRIAEGILRYVDPITFEPVFTRSEGQWILVAGVAMVASRDIQIGEELFLDYDYPISKYRPSWYEPVADS